MRIGLVTHYMPPHLGGVEMVARTLYEGYRAAGHEVRWVASRVPRDAPRRDGDLVRVGCVNLAERFLDVPVPVWGLEGVAEIRRLVAWADAVHAQDLLYAGTTLAALWCPALRTPLVITQHAPFVVYPSRMLRGIQAAAYRSLGRFNAGRAAAVVAGTEGGQRVLEHAVGLPPDRIRRIGNGVNTDFFVPPSPTTRARLRQALGLRADRPVLLFVGRLAPRKGARRVWEVSTHLPGFEFVMVGRGPLEGDLPERTPNLRRVAGASAESLRDLYQAADALLLPSRGEGFPLVVQEAMASALPVIARAEEPYARALADAFLCRVFPEGDAAAEATAIRALMGDPAGLRAMAGRALEHARERFSRERQIRESLALLAGVSA